MGDLFSAAVAFSLAASAMASLSVVAASSTATSCAKYSNELRQIVKRARLAAPVTRGSTACSSA